MPDVLGSIGPTALGLAALACPVGMGAMMWFMMRGSRHGQQVGPPTMPLGSTAGGDLEREAELVRMRAEIDQLRAAQIDDSAGRVVEERR